jgi:hypothetical protein
MSPSQTHYIEGPFYFALIDAENEDKEGYLPVVVAKADTFFDY